MDLRKAVVCAAMTLAVCAAGGTLFLTFGCGDDAPKPSTPAAAPVPTPAPAVKAAPEVPRIEVPVVPKVEVLKEGTAVKGNVKVKADVKIRRGKEIIDSRVECVALNPDGYLSDKAIIAKDLSIQWAFVYVSKGLEGKKFDAPKTAVPLNQEGCRYKPHVFGIMVGQDLEIGNGDDFLHNIHAVPFKNKEFNFGQAQKGMKETKQFTVPEIGVFIKCEVHGWMGAWAHVMEHPFHAVTDEAGKFEIANLPPGKYTLTAWHEKYRDVTQEVEVKDKEAATADFEFTERKE